MAEVTMFQSGEYSYRTFKENQPFWVRWLGEFDQSMTGEIANEKLDHVGKLEQRAQDEFIRGWEKESHK